MESSKTVDPLYSTFDLLFYALLRSQFLRSILYYLNLHHLTQGWNIRFSLKKNHPAQQLSMFLHTCNFGGLFCKPHRVDGLLPMPVHWSSVKQSLSPWCINISNLQAQQTYCRVAIVLCNFHKLQGNHWWQDVVKKWL